jgi:tRNA nucleotidyltransferase (CCA-adding enzyme)
VAHAKRCGALQYHWLHRVLEVTSSIHEKKSQLRPPPAAIEITRELEKAGFQAWAVGGAIRDALLGHPHLDWDFATNATPDQVRTVFGRKRTIPIGVDFGTVGVLDAAGVLHEITTFRRDVRTDGRHAEVEFGASLHEDLSRRDFTINAIAFAPSSGRIEDPFNGSADLHARIVRSVGDPAARMREDRLRALRAIRFAARFGFEIDPATWQAIRESAPHLTRLSAERVKQELEKTMDQVRAPSRALRLWKESGAMGVLVPELTDVPDEVLAAVDFAAQPSLSTKPGRRLTRIAVLFSASSPSAAVAVATRLRFSKHDGQWIGEIVERWAELWGPMGDALRSGDPGSGRLRRWVSTIGRTRLPAFYRLAMARFASMRHAGLRTAPSDDSLRRLYRRSLQIALTDPIDLRDLALDGDDLRQAGIPAGPGLGKILSALLEVVLDDPSRNSREALLVEARRLHSMVADPSEPSGAR